MNVEDYINGVLAREGGYVNHPNDRGGPTNHGITEQVARAFGYSGRMQDMPREVAFNIYMRRYWLQPRYNDVNQRSRRIAEELLDTGVNMGTGRASQFFQRALNVLNRQQAAYPDITVDGAIGNMTLSALDQFLKQRGKDGEMVLFRALNSLQGAQYISIAEAAPTQESFVYGWLLHRVS